MTQRARLTHLLALSAVLSMAAEVSGACAQSAAAFYQQNGLRLVVASGAGGGFDVYTRVLARHLSRNMAGNPNIVVQNMPGAAGLTATNWAYNNAPKDGSQILATYSALIDANLVGNKQARFDVRKFNWIGSIASSPLICITWHTSPYKDIRQMIGKEVTAASTGQTGKTHSVPLLLNETLGTRFKVISGYPTAETTLALERGEVDAMCGIGYSTLQASNPDWIINKKVNIVMQAGLTKLESLQDVPNILDLVTGKDREIFEYGAILEAMGRPYVAPPDIPADRLAAIREGFDKTMQDPEFKAELDKLRLNLSPMTGAEMQKWIDRLYGYSPELVQRVAKIYAAGG
jgi:tripartite-type tricarboxylate transporter receptor subunit TctC